MPNWCNNNLKIIGSREDLDALVAKVKGPALDWNGEKDEGSEKQAFCFENVVPYPPELKGADYSETVYHWQIRNWGCKWGTQNAHVDRINDELLHINMGTPWSPPEGMLTGLSKLFPKVKIHLEYDEMGMYFAGEAEWENGELVSEEPYKDERLEKFFRELCPEAFEDEEKKDEQAQEGN